MYYLFGGRSRASNPCRILEPGSVDRQGVWWDDGEPLDPAPKAPVKAELKPFEPTNPDMSPEMPELFKVKVPLFRDDLVAALQRAGVDNLELFEAEVRDPDNGQVYTNYKAVNIIGLVAAADMDKSDAIVHDGIPLVDVSFDKLVVDPDKTMDLLFFRLAENNGAILVHESVKEYLEKEGFTTLEFYLPEEAAI